MNFQDSIKTCFNKYASFEGRASRSEYWWFALFTFLVAYIGMSLSYTLYVLIALALVVPSTAAATRRLHDTNRSGWWQLIALLPIVGIIILIVFLAQESKPESPAAISA
ncbi:DUF805 domain-containing protein [Undibacterium sp. SXout11W]|uniref:DUF805 domain-containing protein n=1 Tax=Undibacterium sp. SXout11W TaxID=3413050 RepID=UPI003BF2FB03